MNECVVWWVKRDLRLADTIALNAALETGLPVVPLFIFEPSILQAPEYSSMHAHAQANAIQSLRDDLQALGSGCIVLKAEGEEAFSYLRKKVEIKAVFSQEETGAEFTYIRDRRMAEWFQSQGIVWKEMSQGGTIRRCNNRNKQELLRKNYYSAAPLKVPLSIPFLPKALLELASQPVPSLADLGFEQSRHLLQRVNEKEAHVVLKGFLASRSKGYRYRISSPTTAFTSGSRLSVHLAWGTISSRTIFDAVSNAQKASKNNEQREKDLRAFRSRLHWRDHFIQRLESASWMEFQPLNPLFADLPYREDWEKYLAAWLAGETGFPMVDASMRCLSFTGFLNFRMRAMVTSFATHALRIDWRKINAPLAAIMYDYEPGIHLSQIQMQAGITGINTLRVYSPAKQLADQDQNLIFVRKWLPELSKISNEDVLKAGNSHIPGYIEPIVDFAAETKLMKDALYSLKKSAENQVEGAKVLRDFGSRLRR